MILVASYRGDDSRLKAEEMCQELRQCRELQGKNISTYVFNRAADEKRKEAERVAALREQRKQQLRAAGLPEDTPIRIPGTRIEDQYAVLIGGFKDDVTARKYLDDVRKLKPSQKLQLFAFVPGSDGKLHEQAVNPFHSAFVCRNPSVPLEKAGPNDAPEPRLKEYNSGESYSLLKCPRPWTLVVKSYTGASVVQSQNAPKSFMEKLTSLNNSGAILNANAKQAHEVAEFLHKFGFPAYVLHTEFTSYVTIGGFDAADDSKLMQAQQAFVAEMNNPNSNVGQMNVRGGVQFFKQPMPMAVPQIK
jgi:cell division septation protein DedD